MILIFQIVQLKQIYNIVSKEEKWQKSDTKCHDVGGKKVSSGIDDITGEILK